MSSHYPPYSCCGGLTFHANRCAAETVARLVKERDELEEKLERDRCAQLEQERQGCPRLRALFRLQDGFPIESGIGSASGLDLGIDIAIHYVRQVCQERDAARNDRDELKKQNERLLGSLADVAALARLNGL